MNTLLIIFIDRIKNKKHDNDKESLYTIGYIKMFSLSRKLNKK